MIDLRSDAVTCPTEGVRRAMAAAEVGGDVYREDPEVEALQEEVADRFGREASLFVPSGVMATLVLLRALVPPGSEVVCESDAHLVAYENGAAALNTGVQFRTIDGHRGLLDVDLVRPRLRPPSFPYTSVGAISVEETTNRGGGAMRQVGVLAAAGRHVLAHHVERLAEDHANARRLAETVADAAPDSCDPAEVETNIVYVDTGPVPAAGVLERLRAHDVLAGAMGPHLLRLVTHLDVDAAGCDRAAGIIAEVLTSH